MDTNVSAAKVFKIGNGKERYWAVLQFVAQEPPDFGAALVSCMPTEAVVGKIRKAHNARAPDAEYFGNHAFNVVNGLQGLRQEDTIKFAARESSKPVVQIRLDHIQAATDAGKYVPFIQFNTHQAVMVTLPEPGQ